MKKLKTIVVEDEFLAQKLLIRWLKDIQEIDLIDCQTSVEAAIEAINHMQPDLIFLDINLSGENAFHIIHQIPKHLRPDIIFVTAYSQYAVKAFGVNAVDYLKKPYSKLRLREAVSRVIERRFKTDKHNVHEQDQTLTVKDANQITIVNMSDILWIESAGHYLIIHTADKNYVHRCSMKVILQNLNDSFVRIHRSSIVNLQWIKHIRPRSHGDAEVMLSNDRKLRLSRRYREAIHLIKQSQMLN